MKKNRFFALIAVVAACLLGIIGTQHRKLHAAAVANETPSAVEVKIDNFTFTPPALTIKAGTQVTWTNHDDIPHTVVENDKTFKSKVLDTDEKFTSTFNKPGTYEYFCSLHPKMTGKIIVQ
jgi:plastocyanin